MDSSLGSLNHSSALQKTFADKITIAIQTGVTKKNEEQSAGKKRELGKYFPSALGSCLRKQYYSFYYPSAPSSAKLIIFSIGDGVHEIAAEALRRSGMLKVEAVELPVKLEAGAGVFLSGRIDVLTAEVDNEKVIVEMKSASNIPEKPYISHIIQLQTYLHTTGLEYGVLTYIDKTSGEIKSFDVVKDATWLHTIKVRVMNLHMAVKTRAPPTREAYLKQKYWECGDCEYQTICLNKAERSVVAEWKRKQPETA
jgi:CRISPR/Cas system-associated exonuclease Cas4 (RecB family)